MDYLHAFESCRSFNRTDGSISRTDLHVLCQKYSLKYDPRHDPEPQNSRITFENFKQCIANSYHNDFPPTSPLPSRPSSGPASKLPRPSMTSSLHNHHPHFKYVGSPQGRGGYDPGYGVDNDPRRTSYRTTTPEFFLSPEEQQKQSRYSSRERARLESPPPPQHAYHRPPRSLARSDRGDSEDSGTEAPAFIPNPSPSSTSKRSKRHHDLQERVIKLERENDALRKELRAAQNSDLHYTSLLRDNERLRQELQKQNRGSEHDIDSRILERQVEELRRECVEREMELRKKRETINDLKVYKKEYSNLRAKHESQQRENWQMLSDIERLRVRVVELERGALIGGRRPGNSTLDDKLGFQRSNLRSTYHGSGKGETMRSHKSNRVNMHKTSSATQVLDGHDEPQKEEYAYSRPCKTHRSGTYSDVSSVGELLPLVTTTPDEQSQVFMVMGQDVSKSVLPDNLTNETELALIYALQNCHSVQEIIKCLVSYGVGTPSEKIQEFSIRNEHLESQIAHLKAKNTMLANSFENAKANMENMYCHSQKVEANNTRLLHALKHCHQACEIYEVLMELRITDRRNLHYFPSFEYSSLESSTRSPDREHHSSASPASGRSQAIHRARNLLHSLDSDTQLRSFLPERPHQPNGPDLRSTGVGWGGSQNTGTTSGLSSMSGGMEGDITTDEIERLRLYIQALLCRKNHYTDSLVTIEGARGVEVVKNCELVRDCLPAGHGGQIMDLEDAANAEELCKVREEKAELRSLIYMMDQEKRRMQLEVARMLLHKQKNDKLIAELQFKLDRKRKREKKTKRGEPQPPAHEPLGVQLQASLEREKDLVRRYEELFQFLNHHTKESHSVSEDLMEFVKDMWKQNSSLIDAFEKYKKRQSTEKRRMKQEVVTLMNQIHQGGSAPTNEEP